MGVGDLLSGVDDEGPLWSYPEKNKVVEAGQEERQDYNFQVGTEGRAAMVPHAVPFVRAT